MKYVIVVGIASSATAISVLTLVNAVAAPTGLSDVDDTVRTLEADGHHVVVNRPGAATLSGCTVTAVRPEAPTVYVDVTC